MTSAEPVTSTHEIPGKRCKNCNDWYPLTSYGRHPRTADGRMGICPTCNSKSHAAPFAAIKKLAAEGKYVPNSYGGRHFQQHMIERVEAAKPKKSVTVRLGYGIVEQPHRVPVEEASMPRIEEIAALNAVEAPETPVETPEPAVTAPEPEETRLSLERWMTEPIKHSRGELFQISTLLINRREDVYTLYSLDGSAPANEVPGDVLLWAVRAATQTPLDQEMLGLLYY